MLGDLVNPFKDPQIQVTTLAHSLSPEEAANPDRVKVVLSISGRALYFSRHSIPYRGTAPQQIWGHIGLYAFRLTCLKRFVNWQPSPLERAERLEQLRLLENDVPIQVVLTDRFSRSVDRPEDVERICESLRLSPIQQD